MAVLLPNIAIGGYRSFGKEIQFFQKFAKINLFIGQNNAGKSNVLRFLSEIYPIATGGGKIELDVLARHLPDSPSLVLGFAECLRTSDSTPPEYPLIDRIVASVPDTVKRFNATALLKQVVDEMCRASGGNLAWTLTDIPSRMRSADPACRNALAVLDGRNMFQLWNTLTSKTGGDRNLHWEPEVIERFISVPPRASVVMIPAVRRIGEAGSEANGFDGSGIIDQLAQLQNPGIADRGRREIFEQINHFLQTVLEKSGANIEIPYERNTILVRMDDKLLPIESIGSGIHEVIILAAAATLLTQHIICIEEPELHLNPVLQKKLVRYLSQHTNNQYFISTHSAALMDTPGAEVYHVRLSDGASSVERSTSDRQKSAVCEDLGYHPSDLLQSNCILWVEGPSDRIYLNWWIRGVDPSLVEGVHYSVMFYGGRLASHLTNAEADSEVNDFISLRRLNRRGFMLMDSDREGPRARVNDTKKRLREEFDRGPGHAWITEGREIENYIPADQISAALAAVRPSSVSLGSLGKYDRVLALRSARGKESNAPKVEVARFVVEKFSPDFSLYDLRARMQRLCEFILDSNPAVPVRA